MDSNGWGNPKDLGSGVAGGQPEIHFQRRSGDPVIHPDIGTTAGNSAGAAEAG
jgi:hypothetical protein